ncbi:MAG: carboxypeptidase-like regulatory domain-containing protein [Propionibacteriaceae bacterium]|nr:carboxypeptidase-like regulatory domain-containing protein [Propionibacteriaceae bacterium]
MPHRKLIGVVMNQAGQPIEDCLIVEEDRTAEYAITTDSSGRFEILKPRGTHKVTVICKVEKYKSKEVVAEVKGTDVAINITVEEKE